ncbi:MULTISPECIES: ATP-binding cassette domain-containing protein [unclassified Paenibacillus]|uniref:ABC transporter ATP-binding protein n=1 Tax=unclassified Paenibacillus TaxID=185978 RepID=UPI0008B17378|nr:MULTISPECIES: ATP-binding cassette domain-containing protein [unclassified Paenibacillus]SEP34335.1 ABC-2 type transport system ATP-binding protein [Paenibacillus sp. OK076]
MSIIDVNGITKVYRQYKRFPGLVGSLRSLVTRQYTEEVAVRDITFSIKEGEAVGYLGPNGAGKSTMIKMMTGILVPTSGELRVLGLTPHEARQHNSQHIGVVFGQRSQLWWDLPVRDSFDLHKYIYKLSDSTYQKNLNYYSNLLALSSFIEKPVRQLSLGQRMRVEIAMALLHDPKILFLDEPTIGLDVIAKEQIREFLRMINREKKVSIVLTTHDMKDIEEICHRMIVVNKGNMVYDGSVEQLRTTLGDQRQVIIYFREEPKVIEIPGIKLIKDEGLRKTYLFEKSDRTVFDCVNQIASEHLIEDVSIESADIDTVIRKLYRKLDEENRTNEL